MSNIPLSLADPSGKVSLISFGGLCATVTAGAATGILLLSQVKDIGKDAQTVGLIAGIAVGCGGALFLAGEFVTVSSAVAAFGVSGATSASIGFLSDLFLRAAKALRDAASLPGL